MIPSQYITVGRTVYEPVPSLKGGHIIPYIITEVALPYVAFDYQEEYRRTNAGRGEGGFSSHRDNMENMYVSRAEALHALCDMIKGGLESNFPEWSFDIYPLEKVPA